MCCTDILAKVFYRPGLYDATGSRPIDKLIILLDSVCFNVDDNICTGNDQNIKVYVDTNNATHTLVKRASIDTSPTNDLNNNVVLQYKV